MNKQQTLRKNMLRLAELARERGIQHTFGTSEDGNYTLDIMNGYGESVQIVTKDTKVAELWWLV